MAYNASGEYHKEVSMAKVAGKTGYVKTAANVAGINQWSLDYTVDMLETTGFSASGVASYIPNISR